MNIAYEWTESSFKNLDAERRRCREQGSVRILAATV